MNSKVFWAILSIFLTFLVAVYFFRGFLLHPNDYLFPFGGDGFFVAYNTYFHTLNGEGIWLESMSYPQSELIFMTDSQAFLSIVLNHLHQWGLPVADQVVGIMNTLLYYQLLLGSLFVFLILTELKIGYWYACGAAVCISLLSPQIYRITCGHFGVGYSFLIPFLLYWILVARKHLNWYILSFFVTAVVIALGLNNLYLFMMSSALCLLGAFAVFLDVHFNRQSRQLEWGLILLVGIIPLVSFYFWLKWIDPFTDRVDNPAYYPKSPDLAYFLFPPDGYLNQIAAEWIKFRQVDQSTAAYLGIIPAIIFIVALVKAAFNQKISFSSHYRFNYLALIIGTGFLLLSMNFPFWGPLQKWFYEVPVFPQFRAPSRFNWPFYYCFTILMAYYGYQFLIKLWKSNKKGLAAGLGLLIFLIWGNDVSYYLKQRSQDMFFPNPFHAERAAAFDAVLEQHDISKETYQGIYLIPAMSGWSDKVFHEGHWRSYFYGMQLAARSGLPVIDGMLSRISVSLALQALQVVSHPLIERELFQKFPDRKPILLVAGNELDLHPNEQRMLQQADTLAVFEKYSLYRYDAWRQEEKAIVNAQKAFREGGDSLPNAFVFQHFDDHPARVSFYGTGALSLAAGEQIVWQGKIEDQMRNSDWELSLWSFIDTEFAGAPFWTLEQYGPDGRLLTSQREWSMTTRDTQMGWTRVQMKITPHQQAADWQLSFSHPFPSVMDELLIKPEGQVIIWDARAEAAFFSYNNYLIRKK